MLVAFSQFINGFLHFSGIACTEQGGERKVLEAQLSEGHRFKYATNPVYKRLAYLYEHSAVEQIPENARNSPEHSVYQT